MASGTKAIRAALIANLGIAVSKLFAWLLTGSSSMMAEAVHSLADSSNQFLLILGSKRAARKASKTHQFGYGRTRYVYAFVVSIVLFTVGGLFALYEGWHKFSHPAAITAWHWVPIMVLLIGIALEGRSLWVAVQEANHARGEVGMWRYIRRSRAPEIPVILLEDLGALVGLVLGLFGVGLTLWTGDGRWDAAGTAAIGVLLVVIAVFLALEMSSMLLGESALEEHHRAIEAAVPGGAIEGVVHMRTLHLGPDEVLVAARVGFATGVSALEVAKSIDEAEIRIANSVPLKTVTYLEPEIRG